MIRHGCVMHPISNLIGHILFRNRIIICMAATMFPPQIVTQMNEKTRIPVYAQFMNNAVGKAFQRDEVTGRCNPCLHGSDQAMR